MTKSTMPGTPDAIHIDACIKQLDECPPERLRSLIGTLPHGLCQTLLLALVSRRREDVSEETR